MNLIKTPLPRMRVIYPSFWRNDMLANISFPSQILAASIRNFCDDRGAKIANFAIIRSECFPTREDVSIEMIKNMCEELLDVGFLKMFRLLDKEFFMVDLSDQKIVTKHASYLDGFGEDLMEMITKQESTLFKTEQIRSPISSEKVQIEPIKEEKLSTESIEIAQETTCGTSIKLCGTIDESCGTISKSCGTYENNKANFEPVDKYLESTILEPFASARIDKKIKKTDSYIEKEKDREIDTKKDKNKKGFIFNKKEEEEFKKNQYEDLNNTMKPEVEQKIISPEIQAHLDEMRKHLPTPTRKQLNEDEVIKQPIIPTHDNIRSIGDLVGGFSA